MTKTVAIYGFAPQTRHLINQSKAEEVWSLNNCYGYGLPMERVTRTFEMHELWWQFIGAQRSQSGVEYWEWLLAEHPFPIYMHLDKADFERKLAHLKTVDTTDKNEIELGYYNDAVKEAEFGISFFEQTKADIRKYPMDDILDSLLPVLDDIDLEMFPPRGMKPYFTSSMDYMVAMALHEGFEQIEFYGIELKEKTEWAMQKPSMEYWVGMAKGRGVRMLIPEISLLVNSPLYGMGVAQMIPVQVPEALKRKYIEKMDYWRNMFNLLAGRHQALVEGGKEAEAKELYMEIEAVKWKIAMYEGAANAMTHQIDHENLKIDDLEIETITKFEPVPDHKPSQQPVPVPQEA